MKYLFLLLFVPSVLMAECVSQLTYDKMEARYELRGEEVPPIYEVCDYTCTTTATWNRFDALLTITDIDNGYSGTFELLQLRFNGEVFIIEQFIP